MYSQDFGVDSVVTLSNQMGDLSTLNALVRLDQTIHNEKF